MELPTAPGSSVPDMKKLGGFGDLETPACNYPSWGTCPTIYLLCVLPSPRHGVPLPSNRLCGGDIGR